MKYTLVDQTQVV